MRELLRPLANRVVPSRRTKAQQWRRIDAAFQGADTVEGGLFAGMRLSGGFTGSHHPKRLGTYEQELHPLLSALPPYDRVLDVGCGEGWYVVGLARMWPKAEVYGFDIAEDARAQCAANARLNDVTVHINGVATPHRLAELVAGRTLLIVDAEGAEVDVLDPDQAPGLRSADLLIELHDFLRPGATETILSRFPERSPTFIDQAPRLRDGHPRLKGLSTADADRALAESRDPSQRWLWIPSPSRLAG